MSVKMSEFISNTYLPAKLVRSTILQLGSWKYFKESARDIAEFSAMVGWSGFTYYKDTVPFFRRNKKDILDLVESTASDCGMDLGKFIADFNGVGATPSEVYKAIYLGKGDSCVEVANALAWYALEEVARSYCDLF